MEREIVIKQENGNDGQSVYLYYEPSSGNYLAFGLSAYYSDMAASPVLSYSEEMQLPMATLDRSGILDLRQSMTMVEHTIDKSYCFRTRQHIGREGYDRWVKKSVRKA